MRARAALYCSGRGAGDFGLGEMPQGERRDAVLNGARRQEIVPSGRAGEFRLDELPQGECRETILRGGGEHGEGQEIVLSGTMGSSGSKSCRRAGAGRLCCAGDRRGRAGGGGMLL